MANSEQKNNSFHESKIQVTYDIPHIKVGSEEFYKLEKLGFKELKTSVFVLVVWGSGERLGYKGIKRITNRINYKKNIYSIIYRINFSIWR